MIKKVIDKYLLKPMNSVLFLEIDMGRWGPLHPPPPPHQGPYRPTWAPKPKGSYTIACCHLTETQRTK